MQELSKILDQLPGWAEVDLNLKRQAPVGERNNHCIKLAPALLRAGRTPSETLEALIGLYPEAPEKELRGVVRRAVAYAKENTPVTYDPEYWKEKSRLSSLQTTATRMRPKILAKYTMPDIESTTVNLPLHEQRRLFLERMYKPEDTIWIGNKFSSGPKFKYCFRTAQAWLGQRTIRGEFVSHSTFLPGSCNRNMDSIAERRFLVLESDLLHPQELASIAHYLNTRNKLEMRAIVTTGGIRHAPAAGLHFWFTFPTAGIGDWAALFHGYGADIATLRGPQPVRLPGCVRANTSQRQELIWIK